MKTQLRKFARLQQQQQQDSFNENTSKADNLRRGLDTAPAQGPDARLHFLLIFRYHGATSNRACTAIHGIMPKIELPIEELQKQTFRMVFPRYVELATNMATARVIRDPCSLFQHFYYAKYCRILQNTAYLLQNICRF